MTTNTDSTEELPTLSVVVTLHNAATEVRCIVEKLQTVGRRSELEIVLVDNGSTDATAAVCCGLMEKFPNTIFVRLSRTFSADNVVLAGLRHANGDYFAVLGSRGEPGADDVGHMLDEITKTGQDVVYGVPVWQRNTWRDKARRHIENRLATVMLQKPEGIFLSPFKVFNRFVLEQVTSYRGPFPFLDGLIFRSTQNIGQVALNHVEPGKRPGKSTRAKRLEGWLNMFLNFSVIPLRLSTYVGVAAAGFSVLALGLIWIDKIYFTKNMTPGIRTTLALISLSAGIQLMLLGVLGEYLGRLFLDQTGTPQAIERYVKRGGRQASVPPR